MLRRIREVRLGTSSPGVPTAGLQLILAGAQALDRLTQRGLLDKRRLQQELDTHRLYLLTEFRAHGMPGSALSSSPAGQGRLTARHCAGSPADAGEIAGRASRLQHQVCT